MVRYSKTSEIFFPSTVIFDMDGVITDTMPYHLKAWQKVFTDNGFTVSNIDIYTREGQKGLESIKEIALLAGRSFSLALAKKMQQEKEQYFKKIFCLRFIPNARTLIQKVHSLGYRLALVTGTPRLEVEHILPPRLLSYFEVIVTGSDVRNGKPHPEPYIRALKSLHIRPRDAIVIENAPFGIASAKAAGIPCFAITTSLPAQYLQAADKIFQNHKQIYQFFNAQVIS